MSRTFLLLLLSAMVVGAGASPISPPLLPELREAPWTDSIPPLILCPANDTIALGPSACSVVYDYFVNAADNEPGWVLSLVVGIAPGDTFPIGTTLNVFLVTDAAGNTATCAFSVLVQPYAANLLCQDQVAVELNANCAHTLLASETLEGGPYGCISTFQMEVDKVVPFGNGPWLPAEFGVGDMGKTYQYRVTDPATGNKCWGNVTIHDEMPPALVCSSLTVPCVVDELSPDFLKDSLGIAAAMPGVTENCGGSVSLTFLDLPENLPCDNNPISGRINRIWTALDGRGNLSACTQVINRSRVLADLQVPADLTVNCAGADLSPASTGLPFIAFAGRNFPFTEDSYCEFQAEYEDSLLTFCDGSRRLLRTWVLYDVCLDFSPSNPKTGVQTIDIMDNGGPNITCPNDLTVTLPGANCQVVLDFPDVVLADFCSRINSVEAIWTSGNQSDTLAGSLINFGGNDPQNPDTLAAFGTVFNFPVGTATVQYRATDDCGNSGTCSFILTVWDLAPPTAACAALPAVALTANGQATLAATALNNGSTDACNPLAFKARRAGATACQPNDEFYDALQFCCADAGDTVAVTLRVYDVGVPAGPVSPDFAAAHADDCTAFVVVVDNLPASCTAPPDVAVACTVFDPTLAGYGAPLLSCRVDSVAVTANYADFEESCKRGTLIRTFQTYADGVAAGQCSQQIVVSYQQDYYVRFPDDVVAPSCDGTGDYGEPIFSGLDCEDLEIAYTDEVFDVVPDACFKIERTWTVWNRCTYNDQQPLVTVPNPNPVATPVNSPANLPGPVVSAPGTTGIWAPSLVKINPTDPQPTDFSTFWTANVNGYRYKQIIKVIDTQGPTTTNCPGGPQSIPDSTTNHPLFWNETYWTNPFTNGNDLCEAETNLVITAGDACTGADISIAYQLFLDLDYDGNRETVVVSTDLPGSNNVQFGNAGNPNFSGGTPSAFDERPVPANKKYRFAIDRVKNGNMLTACVRWDTEFQPVDPDNTTMDGVVPQLPLGTHRIKWIIDDACGNQKTCDYLFSVYDAIGSCLPPGVPIGGYVETETGAGVNGVIVTLAGDHPTLPSFSYLDTTDTDGLFVYDQAVPQGSFFTLTPVRDDNPMNGVSTFDLVLMSKHILGITPLNSPYKIIGADINKSNSVTTFDIVELRKLILGIYSTFPNNDAWRFVPTEFDFLNPANPFMPSFPEIYSIGNLQPNGLLSYDFVGIKTGDLSGDANPGVNAAAEDRTAGTVWFDAGQDRALQAGDVFQVTIKATEKMLGYQFTLLFNDLELLDVLPGAGLGLDHFGIFPALPEGGSGALTVSAVGDAPEFALQFRASAAGRLSDLLRISSSITQAEAYRPNDLMASNDPMIKTAVALRFDAGAGDFTAGVILRQNTPNPFSDKTWIEFYLPEATLATLTVFDLNGRAVWVREDQFAAGEHRFRLDGATLGAPGVFSYELKTPSARMVKKMVLLEKMP